MNGPPIAINVNSEIEILQSVVVHCPGEEIVRMTQHQLDLLLFDDILSPAETAREHNTMAEILRSAGACVLDIADLLSRALAEAPREGRKDLLTRVWEMAGLPAFPEELIDWPAKALAQGLIAGIYWDDLRQAKRSLARLRAEQKQPTAMALSPVPNLMFMRDPCVAIGNRIMMGRMATDARNREPLLVAFALAQSGLLESPQFLFAEPDPHRHPLFRRIEGGDILVISDEVLFIGCSQRTSAQTIERVCEEALFDTFPKLKRVYAVLMPEERSTMHLDTILTQIDRKLFLGYTPLIAPRPDQRDGGAKVIRLQPGCEAEKVSSSASVFDVLREELGEDTRIVPCGGDELLHQQREQWTDGANAFCLSPGHIILYGRNVNTIAKLKEQGFDEVRIHSVQLADERRAMVVDGMRRPRTVFSFAGSELSRARGGGRCLTMPLTRG
jgi:arginine deiminase